MARITKARTGTGDGGFSNLVSGLKIRKSSEVCALQNHIQFFNNELKTFVFCSEAYKSVPEEHTLFLKYLYSSFGNSFSASVYFNFENSAYSLATERLLFLESLIKELSEQVGKTDEFVIIEKDLLNLEKVMLYIRQVEHLFWRLLDLNNYYFIDSNQYEIRQNITQDFGRFLNALSDYFFILIRYLSSKTEYWSKEI